MRICPPFAERPACANRINRFRRSGSVPSDDTPAAPDLRLVLLVDLEPVVWIRSACVASPETFAFVCKANDSAWTMAVIPPRLPPHPPVSAAHNTQTEPHVPKRDVRPLLVSPRFAPAAVPCALLTGTGDGQAVVRTASNDAPQAIPAAARMVAPVPPPIVDSRWRIWGWRQRRRCSQAAICPTSATATPHVATVAATRVIALTPPHAVATLAIDRWRRWQKWRRRRTIRSSPRWLLIRIRDGSQTLRESTGPGWATARAETRVGVLLVPALLAAAPSRRHHLQCPTLATCVRHTFLSE